MDFIKEPKQLKSRTSPTSPEVLRKLKQESIITERILCSAKSPVGQRRAIASVVTNHPELVVQVCAEIVDDAQFIKRTPLYKTAILKNPQLYKDLFTPERIKDLFSGESLEKILFVTKKITMEEKKNAAQSK